ncbi:MAG: hypothetical protein M3Y27_06290 [Acidobacteriota bacterium]|nr:hypothetical protein [Acidobacteriota bacterium]
MARYPRAVVFTPALPSSVRSSSGKTSCCMYPFAEQVLGHAADNPERRATGVVLEVKGDFCYKVRDLLNHLRHALVIRLGY